MEHRKTDWVNYVEKEITASTFSEMVDKKQSTLNEIIKTSNESAIS